MTQKVYIFLTAFLTVFFLYVDEVHAQDSEIVDNFIKCGDVADDTARLACLDALIIKAKERRARTAALSKETEEDFGLSKAKREEKAETKAKTRAEVRAETTKKVANEQTVKKSIEAEKESVDQQKRDFGKTRREVNPERVNTIEAKIERFTQHRVTKNYTFYLDNGQVWRTKQSSRKFRMPSKPSRVVIRRAALGSFSMVVYNEKGRDSNSVKVNRVR